METQNVPARKKDNREAERQGRRARGVDQDLQGQLEYQSFLMGSTDRIWINHLVEIDPEPITLEGDSHYYLKGWVHSKARFIHLRLTSGSVKTEDRREGSMAGRGDWIASDLRSRLKLKLLILIATRESSQCQWVQEKRKYHTNKWMQEIE